MRERASADQRRDEQAEDGQRGEGGAPRDPAVLDPEIDQALAGEDSGEDCRDRAVVEQRAPEAEGRAGTARIRKVFVAPEAAGRGLGRLLVEAVEADASAHGCTDFVVRANANAAALYRRLGYRAIETGTMPGAGGVALPVVFMRKDQFR